MDARGDRYARQLVLPGFGADAQARLGASRVLIVGAGGLGSSVIPALAAAGVGTLGVVDDDVVELSNLPRQLLHGTADVGRPKTASATETVAALNPGTTVIALDERISAANAAALLDGYDLVVDGSDNFPTRYLLDDAAAAAGLPVVWGAVSQYSGQAGLSWAARGPVYRDLFPVPGVELSCELGGVLPTVVATIGSLMATEAIKVLTGVGTPAVGVVTTYDALSGAFRTVRYERDPLPRAAPVSVTPAEVTGDVTLLDVREPWEVSIAALEGAVLIPLGELEAGLGRLDRQRTVVVFCHHGVRSAQARELLAANGFDAMHLEGGIDAWALEVDPSMARY